MVDPPLLSALIQSFRDPLEQTQRFVSRLALAPFRVQVIVHDDSNVREPHRERAWRSVLRAGDRYLQSPDIHEVRAFNLMAQLANASRIVFLQGDNCLPTAVDWLLDAMLLFDRLPRLAVVGGHNGYMGVPQSGRRDGYGPYPARPAIPLLLGSRTRDVPFIHTAFANIGPYFVRRRTFLELGGFSTQWGAAGEPGGLFCVELGLRAWLRGYHVGVYYGEVGNGVGGYKSRAPGKQARLRRAHDRNTTKYLEAKMAVHNATVLSRVDAANSQLRRMSKDKALELQQRKRESRLPCQSARAKSRTTSENVTETATHQ